MNYAIIEGDVVVNVAASQKPLAENWIKSETAQIGDRYVSGEFVSAGAKALSGQTLISAIAERRYAEETKGITVSGSAIKTDRESQALITGAVLAATIDPSYVCQWKTSGGFITLDAAAIIGVATAVRNHVQACFNREAELIAAIEDETYTSDMLNEGWPA